MLIICLGIYSKLYYVLLFDRLLLKISRKSGLDYGLNYIIYFLIYVYKKDYISYLMILSPKFLMNLMYQLMFRILMIKFTVIIIMLDYLVSDLNYLSKLLSIFQFNYYWLVIKKLKFIHLLLKV